MSRKAAVGAVSACLLALLPALAAGSASLLPTNKKPSDWTQSDMEDYGQDVLMRTACFGLLLAVLYGLIECVFCLYCCCAPAPSQMVSSKRPRYEQFVALNGRVNKKLPGTKVFFIGVVVFILALAGCVLGTWGYWTNYKVAMVDTYDGVHELTTDFATFICSADNSENCEEQTLGDFLQDAKDEAGDIFDSASAYLTSLGDLTQGLEDAIEEADNTIYYLNEMDYTLDRINANITAANNILSDLQSNTDVPAGVKSALPEEIDEVDDGGIISDAVALVTSSQTTASDIMDDMDVYYDDSIAALLERIDGDELTGDTDERVELFDTIDDILNSMFDVRDEVVDIADSIHDNRPMVVKVFDYITMGISLMFALPAIVLLLTGSCTGCCKGVTPMYLDLSFTYFCQMYFCIAAGFTLFFAILWNDVCVVHTEVIEVTLGNYSTTIRDTKIYLQDSVMDVLKCGHNKNSDVDQNLAAILGIENEFNVSEYVDPVVEDMYEVRDYILNQTVIVEDAIDDIDTMLDTFVDYALNTELYMQNVTAGIEQCDELLSALPSEDMGGNRDNVTEQDKVTTFYGSEISFTAYQTSLNALNTELGLMNFVPSPYAPVLTFESVQGLTTTLMASPDWVDSDANQACDGGGANCADYGATSWAAVNTAVDDADNYQATLDAVIAGNNDLRNEIEALRQYLVNVQIGIDLLDSQQQSMTDSAQLITEDLQGMVDAIEDAVNGLDEQIDEVYSIVDFVASAPDYLGCEWIGDFYVNVIKGDFCTDSVDALFNASAPMVAVPTLMLLFFCFAAIYIPVLKDARNARRSKPTETAFDLENNADAVAPPPPAMAFLDAEPAFPEQKTNELEMGKLDDESRTTSVKRKKMTF